MSSSRRRGGANAPLALLIIFVVWVSISSAGCSGGTGGATAIATATATTAPSGAGSATTPPGTTAATPPAARPLGPLATHGDRIVDDQGRAVILRGVNYSERGKVPPFAGWHAPASWDLMKQSGFTVVRYVMVWEAIEPVRGRYDAGYIADLRAQLDACAARGIRVILDMHQDMWSRAFGGDGAPGWATLDSPLLPNTPLGFPENYVNPEVVRNFDRFWSDDGLKAAFRDAWLHVVAELGAHPAVIGYDLFNEPFAGLELPGRFDAGRLSDFYAFLIPPMQAADPDALFFIEGNILTSFGVPANLRPLGLPNVVYAPHWYDPVIDVRRALGMAAFDGGSRARTALGLAAHEAFADRLGVPLFVGEYGSNMDDPDGEQLVADHQDLFDDLLIGAALWNWNPSSAHTFSPVSPGPQPKRSLAALARPYPAAIAGRPRAIRFDPASAVLTLTFDEDPGVAAGAATEICLASDRWFPSGIAVESSDPAGSWSWAIDAATGRLIVSSDRAQASHTIRVRPR